MDLGGLALDLRPPVQGLGWDGIYQTQELGPGNFCPKTRAGETAYLDKYSNYLLSPVLNRPRGRASRGR